MDDVTETRTYSGRGEFADGPPKRGTSDMVAIILVTLNLPTVRRQTIRALCPTGRLPHHSGEGLAKHSVQSAIKVKLKNFDRLGLVRREGDLIHVLDRDGLRKWVGEGVDVSAERARSLFLVADAVRRLSAEVASGAVVPGLDAAEAQQHAEIRRQELIALKRLMESGPDASHPGGRRSVRVIPAGKVL